MSEVGSRLLLGEGISPDGHLLSPPHGKQATPTDIHTHNWSGHGVGMQWLEGSDVPNLQRRLSEQTYRERRPTFTVASMAAVRR